MKAESVEIKKGRGRLIYTPETKAIRLDIDGVGLILFLDDPVLRKKLSKALWYS